MASVASVGVVGAAYAQTLTIETDKDSYASGDEITISGQLTAPTINQPILIRVFDPDGNFVRSEILDAAADGSYSYTFTSGGPLMAKSGTYRVQATYAGTVNQETTFEFQATEETWRTFNIRVGGQTFPVQYRITGGSVQNMVPDEATATLTVTISSTSDGNLQIRLPRNVIDSRDGADGRSGSDLDFAVFIDDENVTPEQTEATVDRRTLSIDFANGTETIEIVGTWAVPEFGAIAAIVLAVAIVGIIVATARYGKFNFAPRL
ncbi:PEFG-CTERM sorting domain-containing protein [Candidatus Nitrososphaera gargensis]|nr:PEFG-CTERM sorting domain-containing protein [Candidatus Nitrososphaera gargensis]